MTPLHGIACFCDIGFGARTVSRKTPVYFICLILASLLIAILVALAIPTITSNDFGGGCPHETDLVANKQM